MGVIGVLAYIAFGAALWAIVSHIRKGNIEKQERRIEEIAASTREPKP